MLPSASPMLDDNLQVSQRLASDFTTTPQQCNKEIDNSANRAGQHSARHVRQKCKMKSLFREEKNTNSQKLCNTKLDYTSRLMGVNFCAGTCLSSLYRSKNTDRDKQSKKGDKHTEILRATQMLTACSPDLLTKQRRYQGHECVSRIQKNTNRDPENWCSRQKLPTT